MKFKEILLASAFLLSSSLAFPQKPLHFDVYSREEGFLNLLRSSSLRVSPKEIDFSFLFGIYSMKFKKMTDSTYQEIVDDNSLLDSKKEFFDYLFKDSCYTLKNYSARGGKPREEKELLEGKIFDKKYKTPPEVFDYFKRGKIKDSDSIHFVVCGLPYSVEIRIVEKKDSVTYSCSLENIIKREPGDNILFPYPIKAYTIKKNGELFPLGFSTEFLKVRSGKRIPIKGKLREK